MKKQTVIQIKETLSSLHTNIKLYFISWLTDNMLDDVDSYIEATHSTLSYPYCHSDHMLLSLEIH
ncbi:MAG: hypothetical protein ACTS73_01585 [Arsenophonus sp. NEOnobi-MAG3]